MRKFAAAPRVIMIALTLLSICWQPKISKAEQVDGYWWSGLSPSDKIHTFSFFVIGYRNGWAQGQKEGLVFSTLEIMAKLDKDAVPIPKATEIKIWESLASSIKTNSLPALKNPAAQLINELDAFYQTYPLCKSQSVETMLSQIINVWLVETPLKTTYKEIGEKCAEKR